jgi:hypothetical protein
MRKDEVIRFLQLLLYYEVLPLNAQKSDYNEIGKYCLRTKFVNTTPDGNYVISEKGLNLLTGKIQWDDELLWLTKRYDKVWQTTYWLTGLAVGCIMVYELVIKGALNS